MENSTRERVRDIAAKLFAEKGLAGVSLQEIAQATGVDDAEVTKLFGSGEKLYEAVLETHFTLYATRMDAVFGGDEGPADKVELYAHAMCDLHKQAPHFFPLFYRELLNPSLFFEPIVKKKIQHVSYLSDNNIAKGIQKGQFKRGLNPANATMFLAGMFHYYYLARHLRGSLLPEPANEEEYLNQALKVFLTGLKKGAAANITGQAL